jgi:hypothetical protein
LRGAPRCASSMTTKKCEPQAEYDFRTGVRGKHHRGSSDSASASGVPRDSPSKAAREPGDRAPKPNKGERRNRNL